MNINLRNLLELNLTSVYNAKNLILKLDEEILRLREIDVKEQRKPFFDQYYILNHQKIYLSHYSWFCVKKFINEQWLLSQKLEDKAFIKNEALFRCLENVPLIMELKAVGYDPRWIISRTVSKVIVNAETNENKIFTQNFENSLGLYIYTDCFQKVEITSELLDESGYSDIKRILYTPWKSHMKWIQNYTLTESIMILKQIEKLLNEHLIEKNLNPSDNEILIKLRLYVEYDLIALRSFLRNNLNILYKRLGVSIINEWLKNNLVMTERTWEKNLKNKNLKTRRILEFPEEIKVGAWYNNVIPNINLSEESINNRLIQKLNRIKISTNIVENNLYHSNNEFITGKLTDSEILNEFPNSEFTLNTITVEHFILLLNKIMVRLDKQNNITIIKEIERIPLLIRFLTELYGINFEAFLKSPERENYLDLIIFALDLNSPVMITKSFLSDTKVIFKDKYLHSIRNKIVAKKLEINALIYNIILLNKFKKFKFEYFFDPRGRRYPVSGLFSLLSKFTRNFLCFDSDRLAKDVSENIIKIYQEKLTEFYIDKKIGVSWLDRLFKANKFISLNKIINSTNIKITKKFEFFLFAYDTFNMLKKKQSKLYSMYNLDCSSSGAQNYAMMTKNLNLAKFCGLVDSNVPGLYDKCINDFLISIEELHNVIQELKNSTSLEYKVLVHNIENFLTMLSIAKISAKTMTDPIERKKLIQKIQIEFLDTNALLLLPKNLIDPIKFIVNNLSILKMKRFDFGSKKDNENTIFDLDMQNKLFVEEIISDVLQNEDITVSRLKNSTKFNYPLFANALKDKLKFNVFNQQEYINNIKITFPDYDINKNLYPDSNKFLGNLLTTIDKISENYNKYIIRDMEVAESSQKAMNMKNFVLLALAFNSYDILCNEKIKMFLKRGLFKHALMITFYNGTSQGRREQMMNFCTKECYLTGITRNYVLYMLINDLTNEADSYLRYWLKENVDEINFLGKLLKKTCLKKEFKIETIKNAYFTYCYYPLEEKEIVKSIFNKSYKVKQYLNTIDYKRISSAWLANFFHYQDATLMYYFFKQMNVVIELTKMKSISLFTNHDCFYIEPFFADILKDILHLSYKEYMSNMDLASHFENNKFMQQEINKHIRNNQVTYGQFTINELNSTTPFVK